MQEIIVLPKDEARNFTSEKPWAAISVCDNKGNWPSFRSENLKDVLRLHFMDQEAPSLAYPDRQLFETEHAVQILDFIARLKDEIDILLVHCIQGRSRSPAIASVIAHCVLAVDPTTYFQKYNPNRLVYRILYESAHSRGLCGPLTSIPEYTPIDERK